MNLWFQNSFGGSHTQSLVIWNGLRELNALQALPVYSGVTGLSRCWSEGKSGIKNLRNNIVASATIRGLHMKNSVPNTDHQTIENAFLWWSL